MKQEYIQTFQINVADKSQLCGKKLIATTKFFFAIIS